MTDKPLPPTEKRLRDARAEGNVARSEVFSGLAVAALASEAAFACIDTGIARWLALQHAALAQLTSADRFSACMRLIDQALAFIAALAGFVAAAAVLASIIAAWALGGLSFAPKALKPSLKRLNAVGHVRGFFSVKNFVGIALAISTAGIATAVAAWRWRDDLSAVSVMIDRQSLAFDGYASVALLHAFVRTVLAALILPAILSALVAKAQHRRALRMSHRDLKDEVKQTNGDPAMRAHQRASFSETLAVPPVRNVGGRKALITNPEHVSVLLHYSGDETHAPIVVGKALDDEALRMTNSALIERVLVFRFRRLARHLYRHTSLHGPIPPDCYRAVAIVYRIVEEMDALDERPNVPIEIDDIAFD